LHRPIDFSLLDVLDNPRVVKEFLDGRSLIRRLLQSGGDEILSFLTDSVPVATSQVELLLLNVFVDFVFGATKEGRLSTEKNVDDDTGGPHVDLLVVLFLAGKLRGHVERTAEGKVHLLVREKHCETEVCQLHVQVFVTLAEKILGLEVSVSNSLLVHVVKSKQKLVNDFSGISFRKLLGFDDAVEEVATTDKLHNNKEVLAVFEKLKNTSDVRMIGLFKNLELLLHKFTEDRSLLQLILFDNLHCYINFTFLVSAEVDFAKGAVSNSLSDYVRVCNFVDRVQTFPGLKAK